MMKKNIIHPEVLGTLALLFLTAVLIQTTFQYRPVNVDAQAPPIQQDEATKVLLSNAVEALGGLETIQNVKTQFIMAESNRFEPGQKFQSIELPLPVSNFSYDLVHDLGSDELQMNWHRDVIYPYPIQLDYSIAIANNTGYTYGKDGYFSPDRAPMKQSAVNTMLKEHLISSPLLLLKSAVENPDSVRVQNDQIFRGSQNHVIELTLENMPSFRIFLDNSTYLPSKLETVEDDPIHGDVLIEVFFDDWREVDGVMFPFLITHELHDEVIEERRNLIDVNVDLPDDTIIFPTNIKSLSAELENDSSRGWLASQWYLRMHAFGIPHYNINHFANFRDGARCISCHWVNPPQSSR